MTIRNVTDIHIIIKLAFSLTNWDIEKFCFAFEYVIIVRIISESSERSTILLRIDTRVVLLLFVAILSGTVLERFTVFKSSYFDRLNTWSTRYALKIVAPTSPSLTAFIHSCGVSYIITLLLG